MKEKNWEYQNRELFQFDLLEWIPSYRGPGLPGLPSETVWIGEYKLHVSGLTRWGLYRDGKWIAGSADSPRPTWNRQDAKKAVYDACMFFMSK